VKTGQVNFTLLAPRQDDTNSQAVNCVEPAETNARVLRQTRGIVSWWPAVDRR